jgi:branched-chain amino acid transport system substrate-binding protein
MDRRTFLKTAAGAASALTVGSLFFRTEVLAQGRPLKIGAPLPLTGPAGPLGQHALWGAQAALRVIERKGGIAGRPVEMLVEDDGARPADAVRIMRKMILQDQVDALIAGVSSAETLPMLPVAKELETLFLVTVAESDLITANLCNKYTFRLTPDARAKAKAFAPFMVRHIAKKWQVMYWDMAWGQSMRDWFRIELEKQGAELTDAIPVPVGTSDFSSYLAKLRRPSQTPGIFHSVAGLDAVRLSKQIGEFGIQKEYKIAGTCDVIFPENWTEQAPSLEGTYVVEQYVAKDVAPLNTEADKEFRRLFIEVSKGVPPGPHSYASYESFFIYKRAVEAAGYRDRRDTLKVIQAIEGMRGTKSVEFPQGPFVMRPDDHQGLLNLYIWQLRGGQANMLATVSPGATYYAPADTCRL